MENIDQMTVIDNASSEELEAMLTGNPPEVLAPETPAPGQVTAPAAKTEVVEPLDIETRLKQLEEREAKLTKQLKDKDSFINQRNQEIGELRKQTRARQQAELDREPTEEEILEDPKAAVAAAIQRAELRKQLDAEKQEELLEEIKGQHRQVLDKMVPDFEATKPSILDVMKADGLPEDMVNQFNDNPTATLHPSIIFQLAKRAAMQAEIDALKAKLQESDKRPSKITDNINNYGKAKSPVANAPAAKAKPNTKLASVTEKDIDNMSLEELKELEKEF